MVSPSVSQHRPHFVALFVLSLVNKCCLFTRLHVLRWVFWESKKIRYFEANFCSSLILEATFSHDLKSFVEGDLWVYGATCLAPLSLRDIKLRPLNKSLLCKPFQCPSSTSEQQIAFCYQWQPRYSWDQLYHQQPQRWWYPHPHTHQLHWYSIRTAAELEQEHRWLFWIV